MKIEQWAYQYLNQANLNVDSCPQLEVDHQGKIVYYNAAAETLGITSLHEGILLEEVIPGVTELLNVTQPTLLPNLQLLHNRYFNLHLLPLEHGHLYLAISEVTSKAQQKQELIESWNKEELEAIKFVDKCQSHLLNHLNQFMVLRINNNSCYVPNSLPNWVVAHFPNLAVHSGKLIDITVHFPFLELFIAQAGEFWRTQQAAHKESGIFSQKTENNNELQLKAIALNVGTHNALLIQLVSNDNSNSLQELMQQARNNVLAYEKLEKQEKKLQQLIAFKEKFASIISHDFKTPLLALHEGFNMLLQSDLSQPLSADQTAMLQFMHAEVTTLIDYNLKLYNWSKLDSDHLQLNIQLQAIDGVVNNVQQLYAKQLQEKNIQFKYTPNPSFMLHADAVLFGQALANLIQNAIKYTNSGGQITIQASNNQLQISDTGIGMTPEVASNLFTDWYRVSTAGTKGEKGTGLGMSIVKKIIDAHNFQINVTSAPQQGTTITIVTH